MHHFIPFPFYTLLPPFYTLLPFFYTPFFTHPFILLFAILLPKMLGEPGLKEATGLAILNANYMAKRCEEVGYNTHTLTHTL